MKKKMGLSSWSLRRRLAGGEVSPPAATIDDVLGCSCSGGCLLLLVGCFLFLGFEDMAAVYFAYVYACRCLWSGERCMNESVEMLQVRLNLDLG